jgi:hypothetical protein
MAAFQAKCGAVAEWSKALAWKVSIRQNRIEGSNPSRSAIPRAQSLDLLNTASGSIRITAMIGRQMGRT